MPIFAAIDIGANSVRLKIAKLVKRRFEVLHEDREVTRLGASVFRTGLLSPQTMAHTVEVLQRFHRATQSFGAESVRIVSTSPLRDARNAVTFIDWVRSTTGWKLEVISGLEEGRLIHLGVVSNIRIGGAKMLLMDLGGGSCELTLSHNAQIQAMHSLPLGAVRLTQEFLAHDPPKKKELERLREFISQEIARIERKISAVGVELVIATSGTAAALHDLWMARQSIKPGPTAIVPRQSVAKLAEELSTRNLQQRSSLKGIGPKRSEIIIAGAAVFAELLSRLDLSGFRFSGLGLRDGILDQMAADYDRHTRFSRQIESERHNALIGAARHFGVDQKFAQRVSHLTAGLFRGLKSVHRLPPQYEEWISAAAMLHEVGSYINRSGRHRHAYYIIANSELFGYTTQQRRLIAAISRYMGKSRPSLSDRALRLVAPEDRDRVVKAVMLLRLARALEQSRRGAVTNLAVQSNLEHTTLKLATKRGGADLELWALEKERDYFREVFGRDLVARVVP